jgi:hypothetical protein
MKLPRYALDTLSLQVGLSDALPFIRLWLRQWLAWLRGYQQRGGRTTSKVAGLICFPLFIRIGLLPPSRFPMLGSYLDLAAIIIVHPVSNVKTLANVFKTYVWFRIKWYFDF